MRLDATAARLFAEGPAVGGCAPARIAQEHQFRREYTEMPTYVYQCSECGIHFERVQHFSEAPIKTCPECNGDVQRVICPVGVIFKGSGWYVKDSAKAKSSTLPARDADGKEVASGEKPPKETEHAEPSAAKEPPKPAATPDAGTCAKD